MSKIIEILLKEREEILKCIEEATAPYKDELNKADAALMILGHKFDSQKSQETLNKPVLKNPTIKERVTQALTERYPNGAHYSAILDYINETWPHLPVKRTSLSPQLTRLRNKVIKLDEEKGVWHLIKDQEPQKNSAAMVVDNEENSFL
ncbi:MAG: hypothetical protein KDI46_04420 [Alphaproteobacteria bacterium]|nr:hypothetical protein [Alphaproteobacteria bacterium]